MIIGFILSVMIFVVLALIFLFIIIFRLFALNKKFKLSKYRKQQEGVNDLIKYHLLIDDGIIVNKDGSLLAGWFLEGVDHQNITEAQHVHLTIKLNQALNSLGSGYMLHHDVMRVESPKYIHPEASYFSNPIAEAFDEERRRLFEQRQTMYECGQVLIMTYCPDMLTQQKLTNLMFDDDFEYSDKDYAKNIIANFKKQISFIEANLSGYFNMIRLGSIKTEDEFGQKLTFDELLQYLQFCITGIKQPILLPQEIIPLDCILGGQDFYSGIIPKIGDKYIQTISIDSFPPSSWPGMLNTIIDSSVEFRLCSRMIFRDRSQTEAHAKIKERKWRQKQRGIKAALLNNPNAALDLDAVNMTLDAQSGLAEIKSGTINYLHFTCTLVLMDESREKIEVAAYELQKAIFNIGFSARIEEVNNVEAFIGTWPGYGFENVREKFISTLNTSHLLPTSTIYAGLPEAPCPFYPPHSPPLMHTITDGSTPYRFNLHVNDVGHTLVLGPTGMGKSTLLATIAAQAQRYKDARIFAFDKGLSMYTLCKACGGTHFNLGDPQQFISLSPFQYCDTPLERSWLMDWVEKMLLLNNLQVSPSHRNIISAAIQLVYKNKKDGCNIKDYKPSLMAFLNELQSNDIKDVLEPYTDAGIMAGLISGEKDDISFSNFTVFEIDYLLGMGEKWAIPVLLYLFNRINNVLDGKPSFIFIDEAWAAFGNEVFSEQLFKWIKELRKKNCAVILATQSLSDVEMSGMLDNLIENTVSKIFLPNPAALSNETVRHLYERFGLNDRQIDIIAQAAHKREYYHYTPKGGRLFDLGLLPLALAFVTISDPDSINEVKRFEVDFGAAWPEMYLRNKDIELSDYVNLAKF